MGLYQGDYVEDATVYIIFNTFTSDDPSASSTITNFVNTDVHIHKDDGLTQRNNAAGITVSVDFDAITGSHMIKIDTNDDTVADFWIKGHDYFVRIEGTTVDAATINAVVGHFSIENRLNADTEARVQCIQTQIINFINSLGVLTKEMTTAMKAEAQSECTDAFNAYAPPTKAEMDTAHALLATPAEVNAEVVDALGTDTYGEPATGAPGVTISIEEKISWLYTLFRNKTLTTATLLTLRNDADNADIAKATLSDDATTFTKAEIVSG